MWGRHTVQNVQFRARLWMCICAHTTTSTKFRRYVHKEHQQQQLRNDIALPQNINGATLTRGWSRFTVSTWLLLGSTLNTWCGHNCMNAGDFSKARDVWVHHSLKTLCGASSAVVIGLQAEQSSNQLISYFIDFNFKSYEAQIKSRQADRKCPGHRELPPQTT